MNGKERATSDNSSDTISQTSEPAAVSGGTVQNEQHPAFPIPPPNLQLGSSNDNEAARFQAQQQGLSVTALPGDIQSLLANIMRHSEQVEGTGENADALGVDTASPGASTVLKVQCLSILDNLVSIRSVP